MGQPSVPPVAPGHSPPPPLGSCEVRCAGCQWILTVEPGMTEFSCPKCQVPQMLPPELMVPSGRRRAPPPAQGIDPTKIQLSCASCKAILNVPHGLARFNCPQCDVDLSVDVTKLNQYISPPSGPFPLPPGVLPLESVEEINEMISGSGSGICRQQITSQQSPPALSASPTLPEIPAPHAPPALPELPTVHAHPASQGSADASSSSCSVGPSSTPAWGRGSGRRGPTRGPTQKRLDTDDIWDVTVIGGTGVGPRGTSFVTYMGVITKLHCKIWQKNMVKLPQETQDAIFRDLQLHFRWNRTPQTDKQMLRRMTKQHKDWRASQKARHYDNKSLEDAIADVPAGIDPSEWKVMCEKWNTTDEKRISDRNKINRSHQTMPYRRGRTSHTQLKHDYHSLHGRDLERLEVFKMGRCKVLPDGTENWVDEDSRSRYERMTQLTTPSLESESGSTTPLPPEKAFTSVMGKDRPGRIRCAGSHETLRTWYGPGEGSTSSRYQQKIQTLEDTIKVQGEEVDRLRSQVGSQVSELEELRTQVGSQVHDMRTQQSEMEEMRRQIARMNAFWEQFHASQGGVQLHGPITGDNDGDEGSTDNRGNDCDQ